MNEIIDRSSFIPEEEFSSSSQRRIRHCRIYFEEVFAKETTEILLHWAELIESASTTEFRVASKIEAAQIFAFQNDRGKRLSNLEVLKSFFMLQIYLHEGEAIQEDYITRLNKAFQDIYEAIVTIDTKEDDVLRYFWMAYSSKGYNSERPLEEIKSFFNKKKLTELIQFVDLLARAYRHVVAIEKDKTFDMMNLKRLDNMALTIPLFIKARVIANVSDITYYRLVKFAENITFRQAARGGRAVIENRLHGLLVNSKDDDSFNMHLNNYINGMQWDYWNDSELKRSLSSGYIYGNRKVCRYLLWRYEQSLCPPNHPVTRVVWEDIMSKESLEHIAPQTPKDEELAHGYGIYRDIEHPENGIESGEWLNSIGNMLLLSQSQNSAAGNKDLTKKLEIYNKENSLIRQQQEVISFMRDPQNPFWDKDCIERRSKHIIERAMEIWDISKI